MSRARIGAVRLGSALAVAAGATASPTASPGSRDCAPTEARATFDSFVRAFNAGDRGALGRLISPAGSFMWFSVSGAGRRLGDASKDRATLARYFRDRHAQRDQFRDLVWRGGENSHGYANFQFFLTRMAEDELPSRYEGKGAIICGDQGGSVAVWSMAHRSTLPVIAPPARLRSRGWHTGATRVPGAGCGGCVQTESWASTIPNRDAADQLPPHRTMAALPRGGVIVHVTRSWEPSPPAWVHQVRPLRIARRSVTGSFEGNTTGGRVSRWTGATWRAGSYVSVWVLFGRPSPTAAQIRIAQAELAGAVFAPWRIGVR
jgi:hypothetical protein